MNGWLERRIFPGSYPPSLREMMNIFEPNQFSILDIENLRQGFKDFVEKIPFYGVAVCCTDHPEVQALVAGPGSQTARRVTSKCDVMMSPRPPFVAVPFAVSPEVEGVLDVRVAVVVGAAFALKPAIQLVNALLPLLNVVPTEIASAPMQYLPQLQIIVLGGLAFAAGITLLKVLEET